MVGDPRDVWAYRIAVGALGLAVLAVLIGAIVLIAIEGANKASPKDLYVLGGVLAGALLGILIPFSWPLRASGREAGAAESGTDPGKLACIVAAIVVLLGVFAATVSLGVAESEVSLEVVGAMSGGVLLGLFVPSPATRG
jgi:hypothetical protein